MSQVCDIDHGMGASPSATGLSQAEPEVSALRASIPSAVDDLPSKSLGQIAEFMAATLRIIEMVAENVAQHEERCQSERAFLAALTDEYGRLATHVAGRAQNAVTNAASAIEARRVETEGLGAKHESAVGSEADETHK